LLGIFLELLNFVDFCFIFQKSLRSFWAGS
jgi:hypothetical protein